jgi:signal transduction histidine kinase
MEIKRGALLVCEEIELRPVKGLGDLDVEPIQIDPHSPITAHMTETGAVLSQYDLDLLPRFQDISTKEYDWFSHLEMEMYVPVLAQSQLLGILVLGAKTSGEAYTPADHALLRTLAGQTAVALKNARLVEDLRRLNVEITELNENLTETNERLAILDKTKSDFISIASHELRTPLTHIRGYTDMLLEMSQGDSVSPASVKRMTEGIAKGARRLQTVVDAILDVSLIEVDAFAIHPLSISLQYVIKQVIGGLAATIEERQQTITTVGLNDIPDVVADETRLHQAFREIMTNAIKFTPDEGRINVRARLVQQGKVIEIAVSDTGIGIDPQHQELIFEKFYRVGDLNLHSTGQTKFKGAGPGLGLPIARGIFEAHGGRVWVESQSCDEENCPGSTFYIILPVDGPKQAQSEIAI